MPPHGEINTEWETLEPHSTRDGRWDAVPVLAECRRKIRDQLTNGCVSEIPISRLLVWPGQTILRAELRGEPGLEASRLGPDHRSYTLVK